VRSGEHDNESLGFIKDLNCLEQLSDAHVMWIPLSMAWRVLELRMEETASRHSFNYIE